MSDSNAGTDWKVCNLRPIYAEVDFTVMAEYRSNPDTNKPVDRYQLRHLTRDDGKAQFVQPEGYKGVFLEACEVTGGPSPFELFGIFLDLLTEAIIKRQGAEKGDGWIYHNNEFGYVRISF